MLITRAALPRTRARGALPSRTPHDRRAAGRSVEPAPARLQDATGAIATSDRRDGPSARPSASHARAL